MPTSATATAITSNITSYYLVILSPKTCVLSESDA